jgi:hypothetical protein
LPDSDFTNPPVSQHAIAQVVRFAGVAWRRVLTPIQGQNISHHPTLGDAVQVCIEQKNARESTHVE